MAPISITPEPRNGTPSWEFLSVPNLESPLSEKPIDHCPEPIAIVGMACRLPGDATTPSKLWDLLMAEKSGQCGVPPLRFNIDAFYHPNADRPGSMNTAGGYFINEDIRQFENGFFGINNLEATYMDPQQRKLLEVVYECFESAGATLDGVSGADIGCYVGNFTIDFQVMQTRDPEYLHRYAATGMGTTILGNRISHAFNLTGPSFVLDTACSSSLYCLHAACTAVAAGECKAAIVAGANLITSPEQHIGTMKAGVLSKTSTCHTFDASADGYGRADGIGALYVKRLSDALKDGDPIRAVIRGTATNSNGKTPGITLPSADGQEAVIRKAYQAAGGLDPNMTSYIECHGTGTPVGDPIEVEALSRVFSEGRSPSDPLLIGSVKTNLGHSEAASGISGLIKVVMALENGTIPATIGVKKLNPKLKMDDWGMKVVTKATQWPSNRPVRRAGVNSFGYGGANAHAILESVDSYLPGYQQSRNAPEWLKSQRDSFLLPFSASNESSMRSTVAEITTRTDIDIFDLAYTLGVRRTHFASRGFIMVDRKDGEGLSLDRLISGGKRETPLPLAFIFTGQGAQWPQMGKELMEEFPSFLRTIREMDATLQDLPHPPSWTLEDAILEPAQTSMIHDVTRSQPLCTAIQVALVQFLERWGLKPTTVAGHSSGEIAAAYTAGLLTAPQAIIIAYYRGHVVGKNTLKGSMMAAGMDQEVAQETIDSLGLQGSVVVACVNSPESVTLSGDEAGIEKVLQHLQGQGTFARKLNTGGRAYHSHHMKAIGEEYQRLLEIALLQYPQPVSSNSNIRMISSVLGATAPRKLGPSYWRKNLESPVLFYQAIEEMAITANQHIVEIGPHSALQLPIKQIRTKLAILEDQLKYSTALTRGKNAVSCVLSLAGNLFLHGHSIDFARVNAVDLPGSKVSVDVSALEKTIVDLPAYKWKYDNLLHYEPRVSQEFRNRKYPHHDLLGSQLHGGDGVGLTWRNLLRIKDVPWLEDHKLEGTCVFPGAGYLAMAVEAISQASGRPLSEQGGYILRHVNINKALVLPQVDISVEIFLTMHPERISSASVSKKWFEFEISSLQDGKSTNHCSGKIGFDASVPPKFEGSKVNIAEFEDSSITGWYRQMILSGLNFGTAFQSITKVQTHKKGIVRHAIATAPILQEYKINDYPVSPYIVHPITLDACLQTSIIAITAGQVKDLKAKVPVFIEHCHIRLPAAPNTPSTIESTAEPQGFGITKIRASLRDQTGHVIVEMSDVRLAAYDGAAAHEDSLATRHPCLRVSWKPDISRIGSVIPQSYLKTFTSPNSQPCGSADLHKLLAIVDLLAHKKPTMRILELGGNEGEDVTPAFLDVLGSNLTYKKLKSYATGRIIGDGVFSAEDTETSKNIGFDPKTQDEPPNTFDLIILPNVDSVDAYLNNKLDTIKCLLVPGGHLLATTTTAGPQLEKSGFSTMRVSPEDNATIILASQAPTLSTKAPIDENILLIVDSKTNPFNKTLASTIHSQTGATVTQLTLRDCKPSTIPRKSKVIATIELEAPFLSHMNDQEMAQLKVITDNATELIWVTSGGVLKGQTPEISLVSGLSRAIMLEQPSLRFYTFDIDDVESNMEQASRNILSIFQQPQEYLHDFEFVQEQGVVHVSRFIADDDLNSRFRQKVGGQAVLKTLEEASPARLHIEKVGLFDTIYFQQEDSTPLKDDFVEVDVKAVGLNAKDIFVLAGKVETPEGTCSLDYSGIIRRVGRKVTSFKAGDRVVVMAPGWFKTTEQVPEWACQKLRDDEDFNTVSALGVVYSTALYGLRDRARLQPKETVLIHSGAGGLGTAAIEVALMIGAEVFTTVRTEEKKDFLVSRFGIPRNHIFSSRDSSFVEGILTATGGRGVDVILNSLVGDLLHDTWRCCAPFGRFVEVGKRDILDAGKLDMQIFSRNVTFTAFDLSELYNSDMKYYRDIWSNLLRETMELYRDGKFRPFPQRVFDVADATSAFRLFSSGNRIGKIVVSFQNPKTQIRVVLPKHEARFSPEKSYLMIGCLGGLGRSLSKWMMSRGARRFIFLGRSGADRPVARKLVDDLEAFGAIVRVVRGDVGVRCHVERAVAESERLGPIGGVVQGAMGLSEALFTSMTNKAWHTGIQPKLVGSFNLHHALLGKDADLDFFLLTSSVSGSVGTATESNYCAANGFLDAFARYRRRLGKPATSVGLGMISEVGYLHENPEIEALLLRKGIFPLPEEEFIQVIDLALSPRGKTDEYVYDESSLSHILTGLEPLGLIEMRKRGFEGTNPILTDPRASILAATLDDSSDSTQNKQMGNLPAELVKVLEASGENESLLEAILGIVVKRFSNLVLIPLDQVDVVKPLAEYGMDSMIAAEFRTWFYQTFKVDVPFLELLSKSVTVKSLSELVNEEVSKLVL